MDSKTKTGSLNLHRTTSQALGLLVFIAGIVLLVMVIIGAYQLYGSLGRDLPGVQTSAVAPPVPGTPPVPPPSGVAAAQPETGPSLSTMLILFAARLLTLLVIGWLAAMLAGRGAQLALAATKND